MQTWQLISVAVGAIVGITGVIAIAYANAKNTLVKTTTENYERTIKSYKDIVESQELKIGTLSDDIKELRALHTDSVKMIGQLQGELSTWKQLPIKDLAENMSFIVELQYLMAQHLNIDHLPPLTLKKPTTR